MGFRFRSATSDGTDLIPGVSSWSTLWNTGRQIGITSMSMLFASKMTARRRSVRDQTGNSD